MDVKVNIFLTSALVGGEWSASRFGRFTPGEGAPTTHWIGGRVDPRTVLDDMEKRKFLAQPGLILRPHHRPAHSQLLYQLCYPGFMFVVLIAIIVKFLSHNIYNIKSTSRMHTENSVDKFDNSYLQ
jgi:hypothetical protein